MTRNQELGALRRRLRYVDQAIADLRKLEKAEALAERNEGMRRVLRMDSVKRQSGDKEYSPPLNDCVKILQFPVRGDLQIAPEEGLVSAESKNA